MRVPEYRRSRAGLTLVEASIAMTFLGFIGYLLLNAVQIGVDAHGTVQRSVANLDAMRAGIGSVRTDLRATSEDRLVVEALPSGDSRITLQHPVVVGGVRTWGVHEEVLGGDEADQSREDWSIRYTVTQVPDDGGLRRDLVRQLLDAAGNVQVEDTLVRGLYDDDADDPGFLVEDAGEVWRITLQADGVQAGRKASTTTVDVRIRNP